MSERLRTKLSHYLITSIVVGVVVLGIVQISIAQSAPGLEGTWEVEVTTASGRVFSSLITFTKGGVMLMTENGGTPAEFNLAQGTWVKSGDHVYNFKFRRFHFDGAGNFLFTLQVRGYVELVEGFQEYHGEGISDLILPDGTVIPEVSSTVTHGARLLVE